MQIYKLEDFKRGWIVGGHFEPKLLESEIEVGCHSYPSGTIHQAHYHKLASEFNIITHGEGLFKFTKESNVEHVHVKKGDIIIIEPFESAEFVATSDIDITCIKSKSVKDDKYII